MDIPTSLAIIGFAALIHASFQLSVSVLTLLRGHSVGAKKSHARVVRMTTSYVGGSAVMTLLLISFVSLITLHINGSAVVPLYAWVAACGLAAGIGIAVWLFYYRPRKAGTELWIPRAFARHLDERSKATQNSAEAFSLGLTSVLAELLFILPTLVISAFALVHLPAQWQLVGIGLYTLISLLGLLLVWSLIGSGRSLSRIQKWRENNKRFLQFAAGSALMVLGFFVYVSLVLGEAVGV